MKTALKLVDAARVLGKSPSTVRRWIQRGAPTIELGSVGRNHGSLVDPVALERWRGPGLARRDDREVVDLIATALWNTLRRDAVHQRVGITERQAAAVLALAFERCHLDILREPVGDLSTLPEKMRHVCAISVE